MSLSPHSRPSPFTVQEFSELLCSAFDQHDADFDSRLAQPLLSVTPPSPFSCSSDSDTVRRGRYLDGDDSQVPRSPSLSPSTTRSRSRTITAARMFHQVRIRASALILRSRVSPPAHTSPSPVPYEPLPRPCPSPAPSFTSFARALSPWSMVDLTRDRPRSRAESLPRSHLLFTRRNTSPPPLPGPRPRSGSVSDARPSTPVLRSFFEDSPVRSKRAYSRPATSASTTSVHPLSRVTTSSSGSEYLTTESLPSFFDDTGYQVPSPPAPSYSRPATPTAGALQRIHTRLPALRKSKSSGQGLYNHRYEAGSARVRPHVGLGYQDLVLWNNHQDKNLPSPLTRPRNAPPVPKGHRTVLAGEVERPDTPSPPAYVFERRGSATSNSTTSTSSSSSFSTRISNIVGFALPSKLRARGRSKLNLSIATDSQETSTDSSPSTLSSVSPPSTPSSTASTFLRSQAQVYTVGSDSHARLASGPDNDEDVFAIGRVLTPEADPFAKADISLPVQCTPRPPEFNTPFRRRSSQDSPASLNRVVTWDDRGRPHPAKRTRSSLPASPISTAPTFPSSCSVYAGGSPGHHSAYTFPAKTSPISTPNRRGPPSSWSPSTSASMSPTRPSTSLSSSPARSRAAERSPKSPPSPTYSTFPLPPSSLPPPFPPPSLPPPSRALPSVPSPAVGPPVPPKDHIGRVARAHKSLPPSPQAPAVFPFSTRPRASMRHWSDLSEGRPPSIVPLSRALQDFSIKILADRHQIVEAEVPPSLGEPWSGAICDTNWPSRSTTPIVNLETRSRRLSTDSTSTVTASPGSSALHHTTQGWDCSASAVSGERSTIVEGDSYSIGASPHDSSSHTSARLENTDVDLWSPRASHSTAFYSARSSFEVREQAHAQLPEV